MPRTLPPQEGREWLLRQLAQSRPLEPEMRALSPQELAEQRRSEQVMRLDQNQFAKFSDRSDRQ
jgi:hypothetical protein